MPPFLATPFGIRKALMPGVLGYSLGSLPQHDPGPRFQINSVAITSNVATIGVKILEGFLPNPSSGLVGRLISIQGTQADGGAFNVSNVAVASATIDPATGEGTITFALAGANLGTTNDAGQAILAPNEKAEAVANGTTGAQFALSQDRNTINSDRAVSWSYAPSSAPSSWTVALQGADVDEDAAYTTLDSGTVVTAGGETHLLSVPASVNFLRGKITALSGGTNPTGIIRIHV
jgi:hypothetical protein